MGKIKELFRKNKGEQPGASRENIEKKRQENGPVRKKPERRFTLLVEDAVRPSRVQGTIVIGMLHGKVREGDTIYLYQSSKPAMELVVNGIETGPRKAVNVAQNQQVGLCLDVGEKDAIPRYAVISSISPQEAADTAMVENPRLLGLSMEYPRLHTNQDYINLLLYELCQARFVVPFYMDQPPLPNPDGTLSFGKDAKVGFPSLRKSGDEARSVFPVFTDGGALWNWKDAFHPEQPKQIAQIRFPEVIRHVKNGNEGMVLNPFGPVPVFLPLDLLEKVEQTDVYRKLSGVEKEEKERNS